MNTPKEEIGKIVCYKNNNQNDLLNVQPHPSNKTTKSNHKKIFCLMRLVVSFLNANAHIHNHTLSYTVGKCKSCNFWKALGKRWQKSYNMYILGPFDLRTLSLGQCFSSRGNFATQGTFGNLEILIVRILGEGESMLLASSE